LNAARRTIGREVGGKHLASPMAIDKLKWRLFALLDEHFDAWLRP
jgi:hypothetical protein